MPFAVLPPLAVATRGAQADYHPDFSTDFAATLVRNRPW